MRSLLNKDMVNVVVHEGVFHADEVTAIALLRVFLNGTEIKVARLNHQTPIEELSKYDLVIDLGRRFDGVKYFDHHQDRNIEASNMLIFKALKEAKIIEDYIADELQELMITISNNDRGVGQRPGVDSIVNLISVMNQENVYSAAQKAAFNSVVEVMSKFILNIAKQAIIKEQTKTKLAKAKEVLPGVYEMPEFLNGWNEVIHEIHKLDKLDFLDRIYRKSFTS